MTDTIVRVNRAASLAYPDWMEKVLYPELETIGPSEYDLAGVELWLHEIQKKGAMIWGERLHDHLKGNNLIEGCLGLADGLAIQQKGIDIFSRFFKKGDPVFLWKTVLQGNSGRHFHIPYLKIPYIIGSVDEVLLGWKKVGNVYHSYCPAARFAS